MRDEDGYRFRHLDYSPDTDVTELGPAALDALLERGDLESWAPLLRAVARDPWGPLAETVLGLCDAHSMYGTSALWRLWIERRRRGEAVGGPTLETGTEADEGMRRQTDRDSDWPAPSN